MMIEACGPAFAPLLAELHKTSFAEPWSEGSFAALLGSPGVLALLAREGEAPMGFILCRQASANPFFL